MHELSIAINIIEIVQEEAQKAQAIAVSKIELEIGTLAGIELDALEMAMNETLLEAGMKGAEIIYHSIEAKAVCEECCNEFDPVDFIKICPYCNSLNTSLIKGKELNIRSIEVTTDDEITEEHEALHLN